MVKRFTLLSILLTLCASVLLVTPASARSLVKPTVSLSSSSTDVLVGSAVQLRGSVSGPSFRARVRVQKWTGTYWQTLGETGVKRNRSYAYNVTVNDEVQKYRTVVLRNSNIKRAVSPTVTVTTFEDDGPDEPETEDPVLSDYSLDQLRYDLIMDINEYRAQYGRDPINMTVQLNAYAQQGSEAQDANGQTAARTSFSDAPSGYTVAEEFVTFNSLPANVLDFFTYQDQALLLSDNAWIGIGMSLYDDELGYWTLTFANDTPAPPPPPVWNETSVRNLILQKTNEFRAQNGLAPLQLMPQINGVAQNWSQYMADSNTFQHNPNFSSQIPSGWTRAGENIAAGYTPEEVVNGWINSPGHRANLLGDYTHIGIGYGTNSGSTYGRYYTQVFAKY